MTMIEIDRFEAIVALLGELLGVKLPRATRDELLDLRAGLKAGDGLPHAQQMRLQRLARHYHAQLTERRVARERAWLTNGRRQLGLSHADVRARIAAQTEAEHDLGI
jgi:hypothetical protein